jgi:hypothetical protein
MRRATDQGIVVTCPESSSWMRLLISSFHSACTAAASSSCPSCSRSRLSNRLAARASLSEPGSLSALSSNSQAIGVTVFPPRLTLRSFRRTHSEVWRVRTPTQSLGCGGVANANRCSHAPACWFTRSVAVVGEVSGRRRLRVVTLRWRLSSRPCLLSRRALLG